MRSFKVDAGGRQLREVILGMEGKADHRRLRACKMRQFAVWVGIAHSAVKHHAQVSSICMDFFNLAYGNAFRLAASVLWLLARLLASAGPNHCQVLFAR